MQVYTLKEAAREAKMSIDTLKRACEEGLLKAMKLPNRQWRIGELSLEKFMNEHTGGLNLPKRSRSSGKNPMPKGLKAYLDKKKAQKGKM